MVLSHLLRSSFCCSYLFTKADLYKFSRWHLHRNSQYSPALTQDNSKTAPYKVSGRYSLI